MSRALELFHQAESCFAAEKYPEAHAAYHQALTACVAPEAWNLQAMRNIAWCIFEQGDAETALGVLDELIAEFEDDTDTRLMAGKMAMACTDYEKAIAMFTACIERDDLRARRWLHEAMMGNSGALTPQDFFDIN